VLGFIASLPPGSRQPDLIQRSARAPGHSGPADPPFRRAEDRELNPPGPGPVPRLRSARISPPGHDHVASSHPGQLSPLRRPISKSILETQLRPGV